MIDSRRLIESILNALEAGVEQSLEEIKNEAQRRAPVRKLFKGGGRRRFKGGLAVHNYSFAAEPYFRSSRVGRTPDGDYIRGRTNSLAPVTSPSRRSGRRPIGGLEFRDVQRDGDSFRLAHGRSRRVGREILASAKRDVARGRGLRIVSVDARGKEDIQYGGTLRDSIEVVGPFRTTEGVTGYVKASAIENGFNYAYAQEFGTAHNAPQPYLRPALRSMLRKITTTQRNAIRNRLERQSHPLRIVSTGLELVVTPARSSALVRFDTRMTAAGFRTTR
jgi:hypothetical protein